jgi:Tfp pilus assembly protein PilF
MFRSLNLLVTLLMWANILPGGFSPLLLATGRPRAEHQEKNQVAAFVSDGVVALDHGETTEAKRLFERALKTDPKNVTAMTYLGIIADRSGELAEAERQFAAAALAAPSSPEARNNHGAILLKLGRTQKAASEFEVSLRLDANQPGALVNLAQIRYAAGTPEALRAARELFERARRLSPDGETARALIVIALRLHEPASAAAEYPDYVERLTSGPPSVTGPAARSQLGAALLEAGLVKEAAAELAAAVGDDPSNVADIALLARAYHRQQDDASAARTLESALARGIEAPPLYAALAEISEARGEIEKAIPAMRRAIQLDPRNESYRFRYAMLLTDSSAPQAAVIRLREALSDFPDSAKLWFAMGVAQFTDNKYAEAAEAFAHALEREPKMSPALAYLGMMNVDQGRIPEALVYYQKALDADAHSAVNHFLIAEAFTKLPAPDDQQAQRHLNRALELDPGFVQAHLTLGKIYLRTNRFENAGAELEGVVRVDPKQAEAYYQLSRVYTRLKRREDAQKAVARFEQLSNEQKQQSENERREIVRRLADVHY